MRKPELARRLARRSGLTQAQAADRLDRLVYQILGNLRRGQQTPLPGLGTFQIGRDGRIRFEREAAKTDD